MRHRTGNQRTRVSDQRTRIEGDPTFKGSLETSYIGKGDIPVPLPNCSSGRSSFNHSNPTTSFVKRSRIVVVDSPLNHLLLHNFHSSNLIYTR